MTPAPQPNPPNGSDKVKRIIMSIIVLIVAGYLLVQATLGFKERWNDNGSSGSSAPR